MAFSTGLCAEVRTTGSDSNGGAFRGGAVVAAPSAPSVATSAVGGTVAANTYYLVMTLGDEYGETSRSAQSTIVTTGTTSTITVTAPAASLLYSKWSVYFGTTSGGPYFPQGTELAPDTNRFVVATPPTTGTQAPGVDYSKQDAAQHSYTDLVIDAVTNTSLTSAARPFTTGDVGNVLNVTAGTGFTVQRLEITGVTAAGVATVDKSAGTLGSTGGTAAFGGALLSPGIAGSIAGSVNSQKMWLKSGTYDFSNSSNVAGGRVTFASGGTDNQVSYIRGYQTTRGDETGTRPILRPSANTVTLITTNATATRIENLEYVPNGFTGSTGVSGSGTNALISKNKFNGVSIGVNVTGSSSNVEQNEFLSVTGTGAQVTTGIGISVRHNRFSGGGAPINFTFAGGTVEGNLIYGHTGQGVTVSSNSRNVRVANNIIDQRVGNTNNAIQCGSLTIVENNILMANSSAVMVIANPVGTGSNHIVRNNCFYQQSSGALISTFISRQSGNVTLTGDPAMNAAGGDYSLNNTAGAGAACKGVGFPSALPGLAAPLNYLDVGAYQSQATAAGGVSLASGW